MKNNKKVNRRAATSAYLILTENCNLRCTYCFEGGTRCVTKYMSKETAFKTVDFLLSQAEEYDVDEIKITFFGGEPMLCPELMTEIMHYAEKQAKEKHKSTHYSIITNGTNYNEKIEAFLDVWYGYKGNQIDIQLSIDGIPEIQNANRPCANPELKSADLAAAAIEKYKEYYTKHDISIDRLHIHACVSKESLPHIYDSYVYFTRELGIMHSSFAWVIEDEWDDNDLEVFNQQLLKIVDRLVSITDNRKRFPFKHFDRSSGCSAGQNLITVDTDGNIYPCHRFFFLSPEQRQDLILGNVTEGITYTDRREQYIDIDYSKISPETCQICIATNYACTGSLHKTPSDYGAKFMKIINYHYNIFCARLDDKNQFDILKQTVELLKQLGEKVQEQEDSIQELREEIVTLKEYQSIRG